ncbi:MAG: hypothetical protein ACKVOL_10110 [Novosphingobium sp.]
MTAKNVKAGQTLKVRAEDGKNEKRRLAEVVIDPAAQSLVTVQQFTKPAFGAQDVSALYEALIEQTKAEQSGDLSQARAMLTGQAFALNTIFTEMARRAGSNMGE